MNEQRTNETQAKGGSSVERARQIIGGSDDLKLYVLGADGISRTKLNVMYLVGVFIFGWLITLVWKALGRSAQGWVIIAIMAVGIVLWQQNGDTQMAALAAIAYAGSWVHANLVLTKYQRLARSRIQEIDSVEKPSTDLLLEKGILQGRGGQLRSSPTCAPKCQTEYVGSNKRRQATLYSAPAPRR